MPPVLALLPIIASVVLPAIGVSALITAIAVAVITIVAMVATTLLTKKPQGNRIDQGAELQTKISPSLPRTVLVGQTAIGPSCHFAFTYTDDSTKPNRYLVRVLQISDQPVDSLLNVYDGNNTLTFAGDVTTGWYACNQHTKADGSPSMWLRVYKGVFSGAVADATLISISGGVWTSAHKGTGLSYAIVKYDYDPDAFPGGEPALVFEVHGAKVYDDRQDSTVSGGSGSQRLTTQSTWAYTDNTSVIIAQYLRGFTINGVRIVGVGAEVRDLLPAMLFSAYNTCDQTVSTASGTEKRYTCGYNIGSDVSAENHLTDLALAMDGKIFDRGGSITIWPGAVRTPVLNVQMQDIDWTAEKSWQPNASLDQMINCVQGNFIDKANFYQSRDLPIRKSVTWEANDGGQRFSSFISLAAVNDWSQGQRLTHRVFQASRFNAIMGVVGGLWLMELEAGDWYTATIPRWNISSKYFEVNELTLTSDLRVALIGTEVSTTLDDWVPASDEFTRGDTYWHGPSYDLPVPTFSLSDYWFFDPVSGTQQFGVTFTLLTPTGATGTYIDRVEIQWALMSSLTDVHSGGFVTLDSPARTILGLQPEIEYAFRARCVSGSRFGPWSPWPGGSGGPGTRTTHLSDKSLVNTINQLSRFAADGILSPADKRKLQRIYGELESEYTQVTTRATALSITFASLTTARSAFTAQLGSYNPLWNDFTQETDLYVGAFPDDNFPTGWTPTNATTAANGRYTTVTDASSAQQGIMSRSITCAGSTSYAAGIVVKKDSTGKATRNPLLQLLGTGGTSRTATIAFDTKTGGFASSAQADDAGVLDLGEAWFAFVVITTSSGNTNLEVRFSPAGSTAISTTASNTPTGSCDVQDPVFALGTSAALGPAILIGRETAYVNGLVDLWRQLGDRDNAWNVAGSGYTIGDVRNVTALLGIGARFKLGGTVSWTATTTTATISISASTIYSGSVSLSYNAMSATATGNAAGSPYNYFLYVDDPTFAGGTPSGGLHVTTDPLVPSQSNGRVLMGYATVTYPASGTGSGLGDAGGGLGCIYIDNFVYTHRGWILASEVVVGDKVRVLNEGEDGLTWAQVTFADTITAVGFELVGVESESKVIVSGSTPLTLRDGTIKHVQEVEGLELPFVDGVLGIDHLRWEEVSVQEVDLLSFRRISCGGRTFVAGAEAGKGIATHNAQKP